VAFAHFGGAILWVFSTVLLQLEVPDRFRGRVFAAELALVALTASLSSYWTGYALDRAGWPPRTLAFVLGVLFCVPGMFWLLFQSRWRALAETPLGAGDQTAVTDEDALKGRIG
jgi:MFS family permease